MRWSVEDLQHSNCSGWQSGGAANGDGLVPTVSSTTSVNQRTARCQEIRVGWAITQEGPSLQKPAPTGRATLGAPAPTFRPTAFSSGRERRARDCDRGVSAKSPLIPGDRLRNPRPTLRWIRWLGLDRDRWPSLTWNEWHAFSWNRWWVSSEYAV